MRIETNYNGNFFSCQIKESFSTKMALFSQRIFETLRAKKQSFNRKQVSAHDGQITHKFSGLLWVVVFMVIMTMQQQYAFACNVSSSNDPLLVEMYSTNCYAIKSRAMSKSDYPHAPCETLRWCEVGFQEDGVACYSEGDIITQIDIKEDTGGDQWRLEESYVGNCTIKHTLTHGTEKIEKIYPGGCFCKSDDLSKIRSTPNQASLSVKTSPLSKEQYEALIVSYFKMLGTIPHPHSYSPTAPSENIPTLWKLNGWLNNPDPCKWKGVECSSDGLYVISLNLSPSTSGGGITFSKDLSGSIPPELGDLTYLSSLNLSKNSLKGSIPAELGKLLNL